MSNPGDADGAGGDDDHPARRGRLRSMAFGTALVLLIASVPVLGWYGYHLVSRSRSGQVLHPGNDPSAPGYVALVDPTPTALVVQLGADGKPASLALLALTNQNRGGGNVILVPVATALPSPSFGIDNLEGAFNAGGVQLLGSVVSSILGVAFTDVFTVDAAKLAAMARPVAPITVTDSTPVRGPGVDLPAGHVAVAAEQVGPYLAARGIGESGLDQLNRQVQFWTAWLAAIDASKRPDAVPGITTAGLGHYLRVLASGPANEETLPVEPQTVIEPDGSTQYLPDAGAVNAVIGAAVPFPAAAPDRTSLRVLSGVRGTPVPQDTLEKLVQAGSTVAMIGNNGRFGVSTTVLRYSDPGLAGKAKMLQAVLGAGKIEQVADTGDSVQITIVLGSDVLQRESPVRLNGEASRGG